MFALLTLCIVTFYRYRLVALAKLRAGVLVVKMYESAIVVLVILISSAARRSEDITWFTCSV